MTVSHIEQNPPAVHIISLGCAKNLVDTEVMCGALVTNGFCLAEEPEDADIVLINTCGFIRDARKEAEESIAWALEWKKEGKRQGLRRLVVAAGCLAQRSPSELKTKFPGLDLLIGLNDLEALPNLIRNISADAPHAIAPGLPTYLYDHTTPRLTLTPPTFGYVKVAEGCDHRCAYCAIPMIRGNQRSRSMDSILEECRQLLAQGAKELNFIAQDTSRYGLERKDGSNLENLLRKCDQLKGDFWIRVLYTHPLHLTDGLLDILANGKHIVPYLDIPLQHIATGVLQKMGRGMNGPDTKKLLENIRQKYPQMIIRTTFLTGFPGETEEDFQELLAFVKEFGFDRMGAFAFSPEEGTPAEKMANQVPAKTATRRRNALLAAQQAVSRERNALWKQREIRVLLEEPAKRGYWLGRSAGDAPDVDQTVLVRVLPGRKEAGFTTVRVTHASEYQLDGEEIHA